MEMDDAISLLLKAAFLDESSDELRVISKSIATELCFLALAVDQAGPGVVVQLATPVAGDCPSESPEFNTNLSAAVIVAWLSRAFFTWAARALFVFWIWVFLACVSLSASLTSRSCWSLTRSLWLRH